MKSHNIFQYGVRANKANYKPMRMLYVDCETYHKVVKGVQRHRMDFAWTCFVRRRSDRDKDQETWKFWNNTKELCTYIDSLTAKKTVLYIYGHNVFFDLQVSDFFYYFTGWGWSYRFGYDKGVTYILSIINNYRNIKAVSTTNYFPITLKKLGEYMGLPKMDVDFGKTPRKELIEYCRRDVEIVKKAMEYWFEFVDKHDLGKVGMTRASQAFNAFRHRFKPSHLNYHRDEELTDFERKAYFGGRVECFHLGEVSSGPFVSLDVNSMYPFVMSSYHYPKRFMFHVEHPSSQKVHRVLKDYAVVAKVQLSTDEPVYAVRWEGKAIFPVGNFTAYVCTGGLKYAVDRNHLISVDEMAVYRQGDIFTPFVEYFYDLRNEYKKADNKIMEQTAKYLLNSLYGKFAQKSPILIEETDINYKDYWREEIFDLTTGKTITITAMFNKRWTHVGEKPSKNSMVAISAHVTEYARFFLWNIIKTAGCDKVLYCDTDSIKIRKKDMSKVAYMIDDSRLGALKLEDTFKYFKIEGAKQYWTEKTRKIKGVPKKAEQVGNHEFEYMSFPGQNTHLRKKVNRWFEVSKIRKVCEPGYSKGIVQPNGKIVPIELCQF